MVVQLQGSSFMRACSLRGKRDEGDGKVSQDRGPAVAPGNILGALNILCQVSEEHGEELAPL